MYHVQEYLFKIKSFHKSTRKIPPERLKFHSSPSLSFVVVVPESIPNRKQSKYSQNENVLPHVITVSCY